jgi:transaldolase
MRPHNLRTKIFLDSGDPQETREAIRLLGFLDGQTTNPSLVVKNPQVQECIRSGKMFSQNDAIDLYRTIVLEISSLIPDGSVSIEVPADEHTESQVMYALGKDMFSWIPNAHIKCPIIPSGLEAAQRLIAEGIRVNMTLCFSQEQAAAVYAATRGALQGSVFISPFVGRIHDRNENDADLLQNIIKMYRLAKSPVEVLAASIRDLDHFSQALSFGVDSITVPLGVLKEWNEKGMPLPEKLLLHSTDGFASSAYQDIDMEKDWRTYDIHHSLTEAGLKRFTDDWSMLVRIVSGA